MIANAKTKTASISFTLEQLDEDRYTVEHNMCAKLLFNSHVCDKEVINVGWEMYLAKYLAKAEPSFRMSVDN